jgi:hypothetical protein
MASSFKGFLLASASVMALLTTGPEASAATYTIDFTILPLYTSVSSGPDVAISISGGEYGSGTPITGPIGAPGLGNSPSGSYPTSEDLNFNFFTPVTDVSFTFNNFGTNSSGPGASTFTATLGDRYVSSGFIGDVFPGSGGFSPVSVPGTLSALVLDNGTGGTDNWIFDVGSITYTTAVPEPATWALIMSGFGGVGLLGCLRRRRPAAKAA